MALWIVGGFTLALGRCRSSARSIFSCRDLRYAFRFIPRDSVKFDRCAALEIFYGFNGDRRFRSHGQKGADEQNTGAEQLRVGKTFAENPCGKRQRTGGTKELQSLGERDANLPDRDIV